MEVKDLLGELRKSGVILKVENGKLKIKIPKGVSINHFVDEIRNKSDKLIEIISNVSNIEQTIIKCQEKKDYYPLSSAQKRLFFVQQLELHSISYNMSFVLLLDKNIYPPSSIINNL